MAKDVKQYVWEGKPDDFRFTAILFDEHRRAEQEFVLGDVRNRFLTISRGQKLAYVVDARFDEANEAKIVALAADADLFYCESPYLDTDAEKARDRYHLDGKAGGHHGAQSPSAGSHRVSFLAAIYGTR